MLIVHLFVSYAHVNLCHFFSSCWCQCLAVTSACGSSWTFLFTFLRCTSSLPTALPRRPKKGSSDSTFEIRIKPSQYTPFIGVPIFFTSKLHELYFLIRHE